MTRLLSPATQYLTILDGFSYVEINSSVFKTTSLQNIQVLDFYCLEIKFFEMTSLIKQLPALTRLKTSLSRTHFELEHGIGYSKALVEDLYKEYYPLSIRFSIE
ncbi:hypothetical protein EV175_003468 [Coemansia sp. RSA 1933]|nr:hypothetical protein EV175_003468 [Coemansia sp. RSA 1933]